MALPVFRNLCKVDMQPQIYNKCIAAISSYLSSGILSGTIIPVRSTQIKGQPVRGWYDGRKQLVYLPYDTYLDELRAYCVSVKNIYFPFEKRTFQTEILYPSGLVRPKDNGTAGKYLRCSAQIVVAPIEQASPPKETVIKLSLERLMELSPLCADAQAKLHEWDRIAPSRRRAAPKRRDIS